MRIHHLLDSPSIFLTNEEYDFVKNRPDEIKLRALAEREIIIARNLVRKGIYSISKDNQSLQLQHAQSPKELS
jgi:hypothetical protein